MHDQSNALIVGCGDVGKLVAKELHDNHTNVYAISRTPYRLPGFIRGIAFDFGLRNSTLNLPKHFDTIYFAAAPDQSSPTSYQTIYLDCLPMIQSWMNDQTKLVYASSTAVYAQNQGQQVDETSQTQPEGYRGEIMLRAERWIKQHIPNASIVRFSGLYGKPHSRLLRMIKEKSIHKLDLSKISNRIHIQDASRLMVHIAHKTDAKPLYLGTDSAPTDYWQIMKFLHSQMKMSFDIQRPKQQTGKAILNQRVLRSGFAFLYPSYIEGFENEFVSP